MLLVSSASSTNFREILVHAIGSAALVPPPIIHRLKLVTILSEQGHFAPKMALLHQKWRESFRRTAEFAAHLLLFVSELSKVAISAPHNICGFPNFPWKKVHYQGRKNEFPNIYVVYCYVNKKPRNCWTVLAFAVHQVFCCYQRFCFFQPTTSELKVDKTDSEKEAKKVVT